MANSTASSGKRILIITYYWPPSGGGGVQRWLKLTNELVNQGFSPVVYIPENPEYPVEDPSMIAEVSPEIEVISQPIWEPYDTYKRLTGRGKDAKIATGFTADEKGHSKMENLARWVRGNLFIPDARKYWIKPSIKYLKAYLKENPVDAMISTGPPHSMHLIALALKKELGIKWLADFRDLWSEIDFVDELRLTKRSLQKHISLETAVLRAADEVVTVSQDCKNGLAKNGDPSKIHVIPNGFDSKDFQFGDTQLDSAFTLAHLGSFSPARNVPELWQAIAELRSENEDFKRSFKLKLAGQVDNSVLSSIHKNGLGDCLEEHGYVSHGIITKLMCESQLLLIIVNNTPYTKGMLTGKIFEYLKSGRPILSIAHLDGDLAKLMSDLGALPTIDYAHVEGMKAQLRSCFEAYQKDALQAAYSGLERFERKNLALEIGQLLA